MAKMGVKNRINGAFDTYLSIATSSKYHRQEEKSLEVYGT